MFDTDLVLTMILTLIPNRIMAAKNVSFSNELFALQFSEHMMPTEYLLHDRLYVPTDYNIQKFFWTGLENVSHFEDNLNFSTTLQFTSTTKKPDIETDLNGTAVESTAICTSISCSSTPTIPVFHTTILPNISIGPEFWVVTILKVGAGESIMEPDLKEALINLYKVALKYQQQKHLGISSFTRRKRHIATKEIEVHIHEMKKQLNNELCVIYHLLVQNTPILARTVTQDIQLVKTEEIETIVKHPIVVKAMPYLSLKQSDMSLSKITWIYIGIAILVSLLLLLLLALSILCYQKYKQNRKMDSTLICTVFGRKSVFRRRPRTSNENRNSPTYIDFKHESSNDALKSLEEAYPVMASVASTSVFRPIDGSNQAAESIKQMPIGLHKHLVKANASQSTGNKHEKTESRSLNGVSNQPSPTHSRIEMHPSPKSYLSMPSVRHFSDDTKPEPLHKVLEPVSMLHLDISNSESENALLMRQGSVSSVTDPGIFGPASWHYHHPNSSPDLFRPDRDPVRSRKRFHQLLDDTFSLFGASADSSEDTRVFTNRQEMSHSADDSKLHHNKAQKCIPRPKTAHHQSRKIEPISHSAWHSTTLSPLLLNTSDYDLYESRERFKIKISNEGENPPKKYDSERCPLPGSTFDLRKS